ncbi:MAG: hypothetical protein DRI26_06500 [Chloroflexi bacterium]|nr:MAG: hypothetical protein DRI26_06500 [Chloroflexota bacterium]
MRRVPPIFLLFLLLIGFGIGFGVNRFTHQPSQSTSTGGNLETVKQLEAEVSLLRAENEGLSSKLAELQNQVANYKEEISSLNSRIQELEAAISQKDKVISSLNADKSRLNYQLSTTQVENAKLKLQIEERNQTISRLVDDLAKAEAEKDSLNAQIAQLRKQLTPSPDHALSLGEVLGNPKFRSAAWSWHEKDEWRWKVEEIGRTYNSTHTYIPGNFDCNDMAVDLWNMLLSVRINDQPKPIKSVIVVGNLNMVGETFSECDHAWLYVFNHEGKICVLEPITGEVIYGSNPKFGAYEEGYIYEWPSDLWADLKKKW